MTLSLSKALAVIAILSSSWLMGNSAMAQDPYRIVFLGDSITEAGAAPEGYVSLIRDSLKQRHANQKFDVVGAGISGNKVPDLQARLKRDVLDKKPNLVVIYIGINDVWHSRSNNGTPTDVFEAGLHDIIGQIKRTGAQVALCTASVIGEKTDGSNDLDKMLDDYCGISRKVAKETGSLMIDLRMWFLRELKILNSENAASKVLTTDGVHLNEAGNQFVRDCMLPYLESIALSKTVKHIVLFKYKADTRLADINKISDAFGELAKKVDGVVGFQGGNDISPESLNQGYRHCYELTFRDVAARDAYLIHPAHQDFVKLAIPFVESPLVVDYFDR